MKFFIVFILQFISFNTFAQTGILKSVVQHVAKDTAQSAVVLRAKCYFNGKDSKGKLKPECGGTKEEVQKEEGYVCKYCPSTETEDEPLSELCVEQCNIIRDLAANHPMDILNSRMTSPGAAFFNAKGAASAKGCQCP